MPGEARFRHLMDTAPVMIWCSGVHGQSTYFNKVWLDFTGRKMEDEMHAGWRDGVHPEDYERRMSVYADHFLRREPFRVEYRLRRKDGAWRWVLGTGVPRYDAAGLFEGFIGSCIDITEIKQAEARRQRDLEEKAALLQELHHRVKNNAQIFASLLSIQANRASEPAVESALRNAASRAAALAITQQQIYDAGSLSDFDVGNFARRLADVRGAAVGERVRIALKAPRSVKVPLATAVPLGLILNELLTNALRHAFPEGQQGHVEIVLRREPLGQICVTVRDDGVGLPVGTALEDHRSTGLTIVTSLARQLGATLSLDGDEGLSVCLVLPPPATV